VVLSAISCAAVAPSPGFRPMSLLDHPHGSTPVALPGESIGECHRTLPCLYIDAMDVRFVVALHDGLLVEGVFGLEDLRLVRLARVADELDVVFEPILNRTARSVRGATQVGQGGDLPKADVVVFGYFGGLCGKQQVRIGRQFLFYRNLTISSVSPPGGSLQFEGSPIGGCIRSGFKRIIIVTWRRRRRRCRWQR
jgi:hypothetical protein